MIKQTICRKCAQNCVLDINEDENVLEVKGNECSEGIEYAQFEMKNRRGIFTTLVRIKGAHCNVAPVKSTSSLEKDLWIECSKALSRIYIGAPVKIGDIICKNILNTGVDIVCTKNIDKCK